jgi:TonB family protein
MPPSAYPPGAIGKLEEGESRLEIEVNKQGAVTDGHVILTSGYSDLDDQALSIVKHLPELMKGKSAGKHILSADWALPKWTFPPDYEVLEIMGMKVTTITVSPSP